MQTQRSCETGRFGDHDGGGDVMSAVTWIGLLAACCTTLAYAPQALKTL
jgi:hypothetical protein